MGGGVGGVEGYGQVTKREGSLLILTLSQPRANREGHTRPEHISSTGALMPSGHGDTYRC